MFLKAYSLGGGTYTGIEAVSNNVNMLKAPRVRTGKWTMFLMALSLSLTAAGIILLYLLWDVVPSTTGETLNAVVFGDIIDSLGYDERVEPRDVDRRAGLRRRAAVRRRQHRFSRRPGGAGEHGGGSLGAKPVQRTLVAARDAQWRAADGRGSARGASSGPKATSACWSCSTR